MMSIRENRINTREVIIGGNSFDGIYGWGDRNFPKTPEDYSKYLTTYYGEKEASYVEK